MARSRSRVSTAWPAAREKSLEGTYDQVRYSWGPSHRQGLHETGEYQRLLAQRIRGGHRYTFSNHAIAMHSLLPQAHVQQVNKFMISAPASIDEVSAWTGIQRESRQRGVDFTTQAAPVVNRPTGHSCVACQDPILCVEVRAPCGHYYDIGCITSLFQSATRDETLYPPRCCGQNIPFPHVQPHLPKALIALFHQKQAEHSALKRVYCSSPSCSRFLGPLSEGTPANSVYICPEPGCRTRTCAQCRAEHTGDWTHTCRPDADTAKLLALGRAAGWVRCPGCSHMIELQSGCFHVTCHCRTEFCYLCTARWKTCRCPRWDERRRVAVDEEGAHAHAVEGRVGAVGAQQDGHVQPEHPAPIHAPFPGRHGRMPGEAVRDSLPVDARTSFVHVPVPVRGVLQRPSRRLVSTRAPVIRPMYPPLDIIDPMWQRTILEMVGRPRIEHEYHHIPWRNRDVWHGACRSCGY